MRQDFLTTQLTVINLCKIYLNKVKKKVPISISPFFYFTTWAETIGRVKLLSIIYKFEFKYVKTLIKNIFFIGKNYDLILENKKNFFLKNNFDIVVSYSTISDFDHRGFFYDKYFNISSNENKNIFWFLISLDHKTPKIIQDNIVIVKKKKLNSFSYFYIFKILIKNLLNKKKSIFNLFHFWNVEYNFSEIVSNMFMNFFGNNKKIRNVIFNYESVPFQNFLINTVKSINNTIKTYGYLHCAPWPLQTDLLFKGVQLDKLLVSGEDQKSVLIKYFGWNKNKVSVVPSLRFDKNNKKQFRNYIFIPYNLEKNNNFIYRFRAFLDNSPDKSLPFFNVRVHPLNKKSEIHLNFINQIKILLKARKQKFFKKKSNLSIFFGSATGVCIQALEEGTNIIHFPENIIFDAFSSKIWKNIDVENINGDILKYSIKKKGKIFNVTNEKKKFQKYLIKRLNK